MGSQLDFRYKWLRERIQGALGVFDPDILDGIINENYYQIKSFFDEEIKETQELSNRIMFLNRTFYDKLIEEEITVLEKGNI